MMRHLLLIGFTRLVADNLAKKFLKEHFYRLKTGQFNTKKEWNKGLLAMHYLGPAIQIQI